MTERNESQLAALLEEEFGQQDNDHYRAKIVSARILQESNISDVLIEEALGIKLKEEDKITRTIMHYHISDYYDRALEGWARISGSYFYFRINNPTEDNTYYDIFKLKDKNLKISYLKRVRAFRHIVGWHSDRNSKSPIRKSPNDTDHSSFYNLPTLPPLTDNDLILIGRSYDLKTL